MSLEQSSSTIVSMIQSRATPAFMSAYTALVPTATFQNITFDASTAGAIVDAANNHRPAFDLSGQLGTAGSILGTVSFPVNSAVVWEYEVVENFPAFPLSIMWGIFGVGAGAYNPDAFFGGQPVPFGASVSFSNTGSVDTYSIGFVDSGSTEPNPVPGDVYGFLLDTSASLMYILFNGSVALGPLDLFGPVTDVRPMISATPE